MNNLNKCIVHDWFAGYGGSERVVESFTNIFPDVPIHVLFNLLTKEEQDIVGKNSEIFTSFLNNFWGVKKNHRKYLPLFPYAIEQFDLSKYDLILSSSHAVAKGVLTNSNQLHICYCHTPIRYAWDLTHQYLKEHKLDKGLFGMFAKIILHYIRIWDVSNTNRVDYFIANSNYIKNRIKKIYRRDAEVIYPPVDTNKFKCEVNKDNYYLAASRLVPYKRIDLIAKAFTQMPEKKLIILGDGPEEKKIKSFSGSNIEFVGYQETDNLAKFMQNAKAFVFAAEEDFGIIVVEAFSSGTPVIAYNNGGAKETVKNNETGILFNEQSIDSIIQAVNDFEQKENTFDSLDLAKFAKQFDRKIFEEKLNEFVTVKCEEFFNKSS
ncbi:MAG: glycosyl transferase family 1 [Ignavibacteriales bacterium CG_4_9_14_3_um_filter_30_11]|nr:MAG: glycosyl transferase family 1 [Ignavibacteriales bacterium CG_4_9_14_3_um_filter_30_11]